MKVVQDPDSEKYGRDVNVEYWCILEMNTYDFTCANNICRMTKMKPFELWRWQSQLPVWAPGTFGKSFCDCSLEKANVDGWIGHDWTLQVSFEDWEFWIYISQSQLRCRDFGFSKARSLTQRVHLPMFSVIFSSLGILVFSRAVFRDPTICGKEMECFYTITGVKEGPDWDVQFQDWWQNGDGGRFVATTNNCIWHKDRRCCDRSTPTEPFSLAERQVIGLCFLAGKIVLPLLWSCDL